MRIADKMAYNQVNSHLTKNRTKMAEMQNQAATQKRVNKPGDDPVAAARVLGNRVDLQGNRQFVKSLNYAKSFLEFTDQTLGDLGDQLVRAKELAISQASDASANAESRMVTATEIEQIFNQAVMVGNRKLGERFIFGGYKTTASPFDQEGRYAGDNGEILIHTDKEAYIAMNVPGSKVFLGTGIGADGIAHHSTEQPRTVEQLLENREEEASKRPQRSSQTSGAEVRGPASVGGMRTPQIPNEGSEEVGGGVNIFNVLKRLEIALKVNDKEGVQDSLTEIDKAISQVVLTRASMGARATALDALASTLEKAKVDNQTSISHLEDADVFETVSNINQTESTLQATLQTSSKMMEKSLMDFLR